MGGGASENYYGNLTSDHDHILYEVVIEREDSSYAGIGAGKLIIGAVSKATAQKYFGVTDNTDEVDGKFPVLKCRMGAGYSNTLTIAYFMEAGRVYPYSQRGSSGGPGAYGSLWASGILTLPISSQTIDTIAFYGVAYAKTRTGEVLIKENVLDFTSLFESGSKPDYQWTAYLYRTRI